MLSGKKMQQAMRAPAAEQVHPPERLPSYITVILANTPLEFIVPKPCSMYLRGTIVVIVRTFILR